ncbi:RHS repeat-associated core domain-containing protein [Alistipes putredinis]|uniref:RHS repeat domain-containing protein n=1 Tax=Alistipes putredinis TaxID=28117 RepID=UPI002AC366EC|nr:RHS repeat-associated core domain-containing protein [Alistipes putredinis]
MKWCCREKNILQCHYFDAGYKYDYDLTGQLKTAAYIQRAQNDENWGESSAFNERDIEYDKNGNILQMKRTDSTGNRLHDLAYIYRGNQLISFSCNDQVYEGYTYDASGNLTYDPYSNIHIEYNELNLPSRIFDDNKEVRYIYSADGQKLKTIADGSFTYYRSTMIYGGSPGSGEQLLYILHPEGMAVNENGTFAYKYNLTDYMGNVRTYAVADRSSETLLEEQVLDYYPFGLAHSYNNLHKNRYLFSGKELQDASLGRHGFLELYDFGARYYNPMSGRWFNPDPALQTVNPYLFCGNTPMVYIDQDGEFFFTILNAIKDFFHGLFTWNWSSENWHSTVMAFKIDMGWFQGNFGQILSRFTWELPQTLFGHLGSQTENLFEGVKSVSYYGGATAVETYSAKWGGFTLGSFIIGHRGLHADPNNSLFQHEYGHYLQSRASGPLYLGKYAIPSFYDTMFGRGNHKYHSVEQDANARAIKYFEKRIPGFADRRNKGINEGWDHYKYPIVGYDVQGGFYSARSQAALDRAHIPAFESPLDAFVAVLSLNPVTSFGTGAIYQTPYNTRKNNNAYINENKCSIITR